MKKLPEINVIIMKIEQPLTNIKQEKNLHLRYLDSGNI